ncbi:hypothetical protein SAMN05444156_0764 [Verrucomicrobium sp. GAS474]|uniref:hypothetical protein n=1 Tax=Verrucomicrobium sp. GAS474 TaxID=1882831 RepID=UPI00087A27CD|nr:hypothetical protein [Verrucomicrobium sp. GAS474]SDT92187.1 hypothetical protein SAMN05444156_0764 [Verrucomicrobium sp. GAS474]
MKTLFWKEWRENVRWACLGMALFGAALAYVLHELISPLNPYDHPEYESLCAPLFLTVTMWGGIVGGFLLGLLQTLPERAADRWAFLVHRPMTAGSIFAGKAAAGLALYLLATVPPFLAAVAWVAVPGNIRSPFVPATMTPGAIDLACGIAWYFAGMLVGLREVRWWGTRLLPVAAAWLVTWHAQERWEAGRVVGYVAYVGAALALAAWAVTTTSGGLRRLPRTGRLGLFVTAALGGYALLSQGGGLLLPALLDPKEPRGIYRRYEITRDGRPFLRTDDRNAGKITYTDLTGQTLVEPRLSAWDFSFHYFAEDSQLTSELRRPGTLPHNQAYRSIQHYMEGGRSGSELGSDGRPLPEWFYLPGERALVGYGYVHRRPLVRLGGSVGADGSAVAPFPEAAFTFQGDGLAFPHAAFAFDQKTGTLTPLRDPRAVQGQSPREIYDLSTVSNILVPKGPGHPEQRGSFYAVTLADEILFYDAEGTLLARTPHLHDPKVYGAIRAIKVDGTGTGFFLTYWPPRNWEHRLPGYLDRLDAQGRLLSEEVLPYAPNQDPPKTWWVRNRDLLPPFLGVAWKWTNNYAHARLDRAAGRETVETAWWGKIVQNPEREKAFLLRSATGGAAVLLLGLLWLTLAGQPGGWRNRVAWGFGLFWFGPGALFALPVLAPWPVRRTAAAPVPADRVAIFEPVEEPLSR